MDPFSAGVDHANFIPTLSIVAKTVSGGGTVFRLVASVHYCVAIGALQLRHTSASTLLVLRVAVACCHQLLQPI